MLVKRDRLEHVVEFVGQFRRKRGEIVDEIERVLDFVRDPSRELAERSQFLGLHQAVLRVAQVVEGLRELSSALLDFLEQLDIGNRDDRLISKGLKKLDMMLGELAGCHARDADHADDFIFAHQRDRHHGTEAVQGEDVRSPWQAPATSRPQLSAPACRRDAGAVLLGQACE